MMKKPRGGGGGENKETNILTFLNLNFLFLCLLVDSSFQCTQEVAQHEGSGGGETGVDQ